MKLTLTLETDPAGVRALLVEEWEDVRGAARMEPMIRLFDDGNEAVTWARGIARRRGLKQVYLNDGRLNVGRLNDGRETKAR
jgi:hypothetical protein